MNTANANAYACTHADATGSSGTTDALQRLARRRVQLKMGFFIHALVFTLVNLGLLTLGVITDGERGRHMPLWGWALGLAIHGTVVFTQLHTQGLRERLIEREVARLRSRG